MTPAGPWQLPASWHWAKFKEVARVASNLVDPGGYKSWPHIAPNHIESATGRLLPHTTIADDGVTSAKHKFNAGQVLYSKIRPYLAKVVVVDFDGLCSADMYPIETELDPRFLKWWMLSREFTRQAAGQQARTVLPKINARALAELLVPVPPPEEQRRIVDLLEGHHSRLDAAGRYVTAAQARVQRLQNALIDDAVRSAGGNLSPLEKHVRQIRNGIFVSRASLTPDGVPILRIGAVRPLHLDLGDLRYSGRSKEDLQSDDALLAAGDLIYTRYNGNPRFVGACAVVPEGLGTLTYPDKLIRVRPAEHVDARFLAYACTVGRGRAQIQAAVKTTSGQAGISGKDLRRVELPMPSLEAQLAAVGRVEAGLSALPPLRRDLGGIERRRASLQRSLLQAAFCGQLTSSTPSLEGSLV